jgi:hypothetical protein
MATKGSYTLTISAKDGTTPVINRINKVIAAQQKAFLATNKAAGGLGKEFSKFGKATGITAVSHNVTALGTRIAEAAKSTTKFISGLVGLSSFASVAGIVGLIRSFSTYNQGLVNNARLIGVSAKELENWQQIGKLAGVSTEAMTSGMQDLAKTMQDALSGRDDDAAQLFAQFHIAGRSVNELLPQIADVVKKMEDAHVPAATINELLSKWHIPLDMLPLLSQGSKGMAELAAETAKYNTTTEAGRQIAKKFRRSQVLMEAAVGSLGRTIAEALSPALTELLDGLRPLIDEWRDWIVAHQQMITSVTVQYVKDFVGWLKKMNDNFSVKDIQEFGKWLKDTVDSIIGFATKMTENIATMRGWGTAVTILGGLLLANLLSPLLKIGAQLAYLMAIRLPAWLLSMLGLPVAGIIAGTVAGGVAAYQTGHKVAEAGDLGFRTASTDESGFNPTSYYNPDTKETIDVFEMERRLKARQDEINKAEQSKHATAHPELAKQAYDYFTGQGHSPDAAAGLTARMSKESGFDETAVGPGGTHKGLFQWSQSRRENIQRETGIDVWSANFADQLKAAQWELTNSERAAGNSIDAAKSANEAGQLTSSQYIRPGSSQAEKDAEAQATGALADVYKRQFAGAQQGPQGSSLADVMKRLQQDNMPNITVRPHHAGITEESLPPVSSLGSANINVAFNGFPPGLFKTSTASKGGLNVNTSRTSGPIYA